MEPSIKMRTAVDNGIATLRALIRHPMETGSRKDEFGETVPAHYIQELICEHNGRIVMTCYWGTGISRNPYLSLQFKDAKAGDVVSLRWVDNQGGSDAFSAVI